MKAPYGIILVTGPTGSGKTTTLYAALNDIKSVETKIITVEDPVEYQLNMIQQVHVNEKVGLTFASALRSILRQDPDIIMIGEIRDQETLRIAIQAALTGHLVFSTLHTNDAISAVTRIADMGIEPYLISGALVAIEAQRLVRKLCPNCKQKTVLPSNLQEQFQDFLPQDYQFYKHVGCDHPDPSNAFCDGPNSWPLDKTEALMRGLLRRCARFSRFFRLSFSPPRADLFSGAGKP